MADIIINTTSLNAYHSLMEMAKVFNRNEEEADYIWSALIANSDFMYEFVYYLEHGCLYDKLKIQGHSLTDIYVYHIGHYNLFISDIGKNNAACNKNAIVYDTFLTMAKLILNPSDTLAMLEKDLGQDKY